MIFKGPSRPERWDLTAVPQCGFGLYPDPPGAGGNHKDLLEITGHTGIFLARSDLSSGIWGQGGTTPPHRDVALNFQTRQESAMALSWLAVWDWH